jgi:hypothetical protein
MQGGTVLCKMIKDWQMMVNKREDPGGPNYDGFGTLVQG